MDRLNDPPRISCIVCTYNREDFILQCLEALTRQSLDPKGYEVIVVDNRSRDATPDLTRRFIQDHPEIQMVYAFEEKQGLSQARNTGAQVARSDFLTYVDDDAIANPYLLEQICKVFEANPSAGCVGGRIDLSLPEKVPWWYSEALSGYFSGFNLPVTSVIKISEIWQLPYGANFSVAKKALQEMGGFSVRLGRKGNDFSGGEETELAYRIAAQGYDLYYNPFAVVIHHIKKERMNLKHMVKTAKASAKVWVHMERELMKSNMGADWDLRNMGKDCVKLFSYMGAGSLKKRFQFFLQALHNYEKVKLKLMQAH
jgi:glycosyltransferase involved in cell wall biosynthesis